MALTATPIPCLSDNYAWLLRAADGRLAVCDPAEDAPVAAVIEAMGGKLDLILLTHHHGDHVAGVPGLVARYGAKVVGAAADKHRLPPLDQAVIPGETVDVLGSKAVVLASDGHTRGHIAFHIADSHILLCGDTLFSLGCGRLLEGPHSPRLLRFPAKRSFAAGMNILKAMRASPLRWNRIMPR